MSLLPFLTGAIGGLIGGGLGFAANYARHRWDLHTKRIEAFCAEVERTADRGAAYWLDPITSYEVERGIRVLDGSPLPADKEKAAAAANLSEHQIVGAQAKLATTGSLIRSKLDPEAANAYDRLLREYFVALSGGNFQNRTGTVDLERASSIQLFAAALISHIRLSSEHYFTLREASGVSALQRRGRAGWHSERFRAVRGQAVSGLVRAKVGIRRRF